MRFYRIFFRLIFGFFSGIIPTLIIASDVPFIPSSLYFHEQADKAWPMSQSQLVITASVNRTINEIIAIQYNSEDGSCTLGTEGSSFILAGSNLGTSATLLAGNPHSSSNESNYASEELHVNLNFRCVGSGKDCLFTALLTGTQVGSTYCLPGTGLAQGVCNASTNCGWLVQQNWSL